MPTQRTPMQQSKQDYHVSIIIKLGLNNTTHPQQPRNSRLKEWHRCDENRRSPAETVETLAKHIQIVLSLSCFRIWHKILFTFCSLQ